MTNQHVVTEDLQTELDLLVRRIEAIDRAIRIAMLRSTAERLARTSAFVPKFASSVCAPSGLSSTVRAAAFQPMRRRPR